MRGFALAVAATERAYKVGALRDKHKRSFIGRKPDGSMHLLLFGMDKNWMHERVMSNAAGRCQGCPISHYVGAWLEWDHLNHKQWNRCDCERNGRGVCNPFHTRRHTRREREEIPPCPGTDIEEFLTQAEAA